MFDSLSAAAVAARQNARLVAYLDSQVRSFEDLAPVGYAPTPSHDGQSRPVETVVLGRDERGISDRYTRARRLTQSAAHQLEEAARALRECVSRFEGHNPH